MFWIIFVSILALLTAGLWRLRFALNLSAVWPVGVVGALEAGAFFRIVRFRGVFAILKREDGWTLYYRIGKGKLHELKQSEIIDLWKKREKKPKKKNPWIKAGLNAISAQRVELEMQIGLEDAAQCACVCGILQSMIENFLRIFSLNSRIAVRPQFNTKSFRLDLAGIVQLRFAQVITDALRLSHKNRQAKKSEEREPIVIPASH